jgi:hypothetical protein
MLPIESSPPLANGENECTHNSRVRRDQVWVSALLKERSTDRGHQDSVPSEPGIHVDYQLRGEACEPENRCYVGCGTLNHSCLLRYVYIPIDAGFDATACPWEAEHDTFSSERVKQKIGAIRMVHHKDKSFNANCCPKSGQRLFDLFTAHKHKGQVGSPLRKCFQNRQVDCLSPAADCVLNNGAPVAKLLGAHAPRY